MDLIYLTIFQNKDDDNDFIVKVDHSVELNEYEALQMAQKKLINQDYIITKSDFPLIYCFKYNKEVIKNDR